MKNSWIVYILKCCDDTLYTGITNDIDKRIQSHNNGTGAKYTRFRTPVELIFKETCSDRSDASKREAQIKKLSRKQKQDLVKSK